MKLLLTLLFLILASFIVVACSSPDDSKTANLADKELKELLDDLANYKPRTADMIGDNDIAVKNCQEEGKKICDQHDITWHLMNASLCDYYVSQMSCKNKVARQEHEAMLPICVRWDQAIRSLLAEGHSKSKVISYMGDTHADFGPSDVNSRLITCQKLMPEFARML